MENGLELPDDVTIVWCDDNYGYMTRLPDSVQQKRSGGHGVYYHLSYCGRPHDHLWLSTMQPGLVYEQMRLAYDNNVRKVWIANVHDPKVAAKAHRKVEISDGRLYDGQSGVPAEETEVKA